MTQLLGGDSSVQAALPILVDAAIKGAFLVLLAAIAAFALRKRSAASRHAIWTAAVIGHLAIPALVFILPAWKMPLLPAAPWMRSQTPSTVSVADQKANTATSITSTEKASAPSAPTAAAQAAEGKPAPETDVSSGINITPVAAASAAGTTSTIALLATIWLVGAALVLLRLALGTWKVGQLAREGERVEDGVWLSLTQRLANRLGVTRPLTLLRGERLAVPVTWGIVYPAVLLPQDADDWSEERRRFVLVHEMAHVKRFDALTQLLAQVAVALFWFDPLVWVAAHQMRVEREHACDDYVLRDGTTPSLYAGELLEMVRSIGDQGHDRAAPAFAALAMARRSEFEGRMLSILDPRLNRQTLNRRGTLMTAIAVALLTIPLAALSPFKQSASPAVSADEFPASFKVSITPAGPSAPASNSPVPASSAQPAVAAQTLVKTRWACEKYPMGTELHGTSTHISEHVDGNDSRWDLLLSESGHCTEAAVIGKVTFSPDERRIAQLSPGGFARFRERTSSFDRAVSITPVGDGSLNYTALINGATVPFDAGMQSWLEELLPSVVREMGINVPARVARLRAQGGVPAVLQDIARIRSSGSKRAHYEELIKNGPSLSAADLERITQQVGKDLTSSGDLSSVLQMLPRSAVQSPAVRRGLTDALSRIQSSGDKANTLMILAPNSDPELLLILAQAAETLPSSGDKANFLMATAAEYLTPGKEPLRTAFFRTAATLQSSGDMANVLMSAAPYGHADRQIAAQVIETSKKLTSSGDAANVLLSIVSQRVLQTGMEQATLAAIQRTLSMASSGDRANVLISIAGANLLSTRALKDAFSQAAVALPSEGDRANVLAAAARAQ